MKRILTRRKEIKIQPLFFYEYFLFHIKTIYTGNYIQHHAFQKKKKYICLSMLSDNLRLKKKGFG